MGQTWLRYREVAQSGASTTGKIIQLTPELHGTAKYQFSAKGGTFTGSTGIEPDTALGETVTVYYFADDPEHNCVNPAAHIQDTFVSMIVFAALTLIVPALVLYGYRQMGTASSR